MYLDTSALVKLYLPEAGSDEVNDAVVGRRDLMVSYLSITEVVSAVARRRRERQMEESVARCLCRLWKTLDIEELRRLDEVDRRQGEIGFQVHALRG